MIVLVNVVLNLSRYDNVVASDEGIDRRLLSHSGISVYRRLSRFSGKESKERTLLEDLDSSRNVYRQGRGYDDPMGH
jgi:hypothetical protein